MALLDTSSMRIGMPATGRFGALRGSPWFGSVVGGAAAMLCYVCMYAFRKPFAAGTFSGEHFAGLDYKAWLVMAQVLGYALSKFLGVRIVGQMRRERRWLPLLLLIGIAWLSLLAFAVVPRPWNIVFLFCNGLPLGMVWSVVFSYLEGRRATELMGTLMASSLIFASGLTKTVGRLLLAGGVSEWWMPFLTGLVFVPPLLLSVALLEGLPAPDAGDLAARGRRVPMTAAERRAFLRRFLPGLVLAIVCYVALTVVRDFRDSFEAELFKEFGFGNRAGLFVQIETPIAILVLAVTASLILVRDNLRSLMLIHGLMIAGVALAGLATLAFRAGALPPLWWLGLVGLGLYLAYVPFNCAFYERLIATFRGSANVGFLMNLSDACGYAGSIAVIVLRETGGLQLSWSRFFGGCVLGLALLGTFSLLASAFYFRGQLLRQAANSPATR
jgi:hypothetical protein